jgi:hypothetical protein
MKGVTALVTLICFGKGKGHQVPTHLLATNGSPLPRIWFFAMVMSPG